MENVQYVIHRDDDYLQHHGVKGQKWGIRRYQNPDGSLTAEGKDKYGEQRGWEARQMYRRGTITREQYIKAKRSSGYGIADYHMTGKTRRLREFRRRHEKGLQATSTVLSTLGGMAIGGLAGLKTGNIGIAAAAAILGGTIAGFGGYSTSKYTNAENRRILETQYNNQYRG